MSLIPLGVLGSTVGNYWFAGSSYFMSLATRLGLIKGSDSTLLTAGTRILKINSDGAIDWEKDIGITPRGSYVDGDGNSYIAASLSNNFRLLKLDPSGTQLLNRTIGGTPSEFSRDIAVDSSGNIYMVGADNTTSQDCTVMKLNSSGGVVWGKSITDTVTANSEFTSCVIDSSDNLIAGGAYAVSSGTIGSYVVKFDSSGTILWQKGLNANTGDSSFKLVYSVAVDSAGDVYAATRFNGLFKLNGSTGAVIWNKAYGFTTVDNNADAVPAVSVDASGNVYYVTQSGSALSPLYIQICKISSAGVLQYSRRIVPTSGTTRSTTVKIDSKGNIMLYGAFVNTSLSTEAILFTKLPSDGSRTGTYVLGTTTFDYLVGGGEVTTTFSDNTRTYATRALTITSSSGTITETSSSTTWNTLKI